MANLRSDQSVSPLGTFAPLASDPGAHGHVSLDEALAADLSNLRERNRERSLKRVERRHGAILETSIGLAVDFSSNDYLGLAAHPRLAAAAIRALKAQGTGAAAARLISGNNVEHEALESELAAWFGSEAALVFSSGYAANVGTIPALIGRGDVVFSDALNHASLIDGCRLSRADVRVYPHGDLDTLAALLHRYRPLARRALIVTDGLFSMDGDYAPLAEIVTLARRFDAWTYVDDAHAMGVVGAHGRGSLEVAGLLGQIDITVGTLGKAFGASGAFVCGSRTLVQYLINKSRSFIFSTGMLPANAAAAREALQIAATDPSRRVRVGQVAAELRDRLAAAGIRVASESHILPVMIGDDARVVRVGHELAERGFLVGAIRPPTVPEGEARLRITVSAAHTTDQVERLVSAIVDVLGHGTTVPMSP